jgi:hypothetical protein
MAQLTVPIPAHGTEHSEQAMGDERQLKKNAVLSTPLLNYNKRIQSSFRPGSSYSTYNSRQLIIASFLHSSCIKAWRVPLHHTYSPCEAGATLEQVRRRSRESRSRPSENTGQN